MKHLFDVHVAQKVGVNAAIILENIAFWVKSNEANDRSYHDGRYWTYNSAKAFHELFPYMSERQITTALQKLVDAGYILKGNYNESAYNRTLWYTLTNEGEALVQYCDIEETGKANGDSENVECISQKCKMEITKEGNGSGKKVKSTNTDINHYKTTDKKPDKENTDSIVSEYTEDQELKTAIIEYIKMRKMIKKPMTNFALKNLLAKLDRLATADADKIAMLYNAIEHCWQSVYPLKNDTQQPTGYTNGVQMPAAKIRRTEEEILADDDGIL